MSELPLRPDHDLQGPRPSGPGPLVLLLPILTVLGLAIARRAGLGADDSKHEDTATPPIESGRTSVDGWSASFVPAPGLRVAARLAPLHAEPVRQAFESGALEARFGLAPGAPLRLTLRALPDSAQTESQPGPAPLGFPLADLAVEGCTPIVGPLASARPLDPVATLFTAPTGELLPGQEIDLYLWAPDELEPGPRALLRGAERLATLAPTRLDAPRTSDSLARIDPRARGAARTADKEPR